MTKPLSNATPSLMKASRLLAAGGLWASSLAACVVDPAALEDLDDGSQSFRIGPSSVCSVHEQIGRQVEPGCYSDNDWSGASLFDLGTPWLANVDHGPVPDALGRYCRYSWTGPGEPSATDIDDLASAADAEAIGSSCVAITPQADVLTEALGPTLREIFRANTGRPSLADLGMPGTGTPKALVTVLVVDSQPNSLAVTPTSDHGRHMANIINDIACPDEDPTCRVEVRFTIGLPRIAAGVADRVHGGVVGTHADLAAAIYEGIRRWELANASRAIPSRLVINLSVGWEAAIFGGSEADPPAALEAVRSALELASCKGALIIGSVGNQGDFCDQDGPLLPAGWETREAPGQLRCAELDVAIPPGPYPGYRPLIHAVGGLDIDLGPMPSARENANPRLLAASAHVAAGDPLHGGLTGVSVGTAATSATAALLWSYWPSLTATEVMSTVYAAGDPLAGFGTDFAMDGTTPSLPVRVDACMTLDYACNTLGSCPFPLPLGCLQNVAPPLVDFSAFAALTPTPLSPTLTSTSNECMDSCGNHPLLELEAGASAHCEAFTVDPTDELVNPTPDSIGCPTCGLVNGVISLSLHPDYDDEGKSIDGVLVTLSDDLGNTRNYDLGGLMLSSTEYTTVTLDPSKLPPGDVRSGTVTIAFASGAKTTDPLLVL